MTPGTVLPGALGYRPAPEWGWFRELGPVLVMDTRVVGPGMGSVTCLLLSLEWRSSYAGCVSEPCRGYCGGVWDPLALGIEPQGCACSVFIPVCQAFRQVLRRSVCKKGEGSVPRPSLVLCPPALTQCAYLGLHTFPKAACLNCCSKCFHLVQVPGSSGTVGPRKS